MKDYTMELYEKFSRLQWLLNRNHMSAHAQRGPFADPTRGQGRVLAILKMQPEISTKDLSYLLGIRQQSLNELLNKLEKSGHVERVASEADRRVMMVRLTEKGKMEKGSDPEVGGIFECLSEEEQVIFGEYLDRVIAALEAELKLDEDEGQFDWMRSVKERFGEEGFERMMSMRGGHGFGPHGYDWGGGRRDREHEHNHDRREPRGGRRGHGFEGQGPHGRGFDGRGECPHPPVNEKGEDELE